MKHCRLPGYVYVWESQNRDDDMDELVGRHIEFVLEDIN